MTGEAAPALPAAAPAPTVDEWVGGVAAVASFAERENQWPRPADITRNKLAARAMGGQVVRGLSERQLPPRAWLKAHEQIAPVVASPTAERLRYTAPPWVAALALPVEHFDATAQRRLTRWALEQEAAFSQRATLAVKWMQTPWEDKLTAAATRVIQSPLPKRRVPVDAAAAPSLEAVAASRAFQATERTVPSAAFDEGDLNAVATALRGPHNRWPVGNSAASQAGRRVLGALDTALRADDAATFLERRDAFLARRVLRSAVLHADAARSERNAPRLSVSPRMVALLAPAPADGEAARARLAWAQDWEEALLDEGPASDQWRATSVSERLAHAVARTPAPTAAGLAARAVVAEAPRPPRVPRPSASAGPVAPRRGPGMR